MWISKNGLTVQKIWSFENCEKNKSTGQQSTVNRSSGRSSEQGFARADSSRGRFARAKVQFARANCGNSISNFCSPSLFLPAITGLVQATDHSPLVILSYWKCSGIHSINPINQNKKSSIANPFIKSRKTWKSKFEQRWVSKHWTLSRDKRR